MFAIILLFGVLPFAMPQAARGWRSFVVIVVVLGGLIVYGLYDVDRAVSDERTDGPNSIFALVFMHLAAYSAATGVVTRAITLFMAVRKVPLEYRLLTTFAGLLLIPATLFALGVRG